MAMEGEGTRRRLGIMLAYHPQVLCSQGRFEAGVSRLKLFSFSAVVLTFCFPGGTCKPREVGRPIAARTRPWKTTGLRP